MKADGCRHSLCDWPDDKALNLNPMCIKLDGNMVEMWCEWSNYPAPLTTRTYVICPDHYRMCLRVMAEEVVLNMETDSYYEREVKVPSDCIKRTRLLHSRRSR